MGRFADVNKQTNMGLETGVESKHYIYVLVQELCFNEAVSFRIWRYVLETGKNKQNFKVIATATATATELHAS